MGNLEQLLGNLSNTTSTFNVEKTAKENAEIKAKQEKKDKKEETKK